MVVKAVGEENVEFNIGLLNIFLKSNFVKKYVEFDFNSISRRSKQASLF